MLPVIVMRSLSLVLALGATWVAKVQYDRSTLGLVPCHITLESCVYPPLYAVQMAQPQNSLVARVERRPDLKHVSGNVESALNNINNIHNHERDGPPAYISGGTFTYESFQKAWLEYLYSLKALLWFVGTLGAPWLMCTGGFWYLQQRKIWDLKSLAIIADARVIRLQQNYDELEYQSHKYIANAEEQQNPFHVGIPPLGERISEDLLDPLDEDARELDESPEANRIIMESRIFRHAVEDLRTERARAHSMAEKVAQLVEALEFLQDSESVRSQYRETVI